MSGWRDARNSRVPLTDENSVFIDRALRRRELIHRRLTEGFVFHGGEIARRLRAPFREIGLRSDESHVLRRIVHAAPRTSRLQSGRSKDLMSGTDAKIFGLDEPYIVLNGEVRSVFRVDLDHVFPSWDALRYELEQLLEQLRLPCLPHVAVGFEAEDGKIERPHLLFLLPYNGGVWFSDDARCRKDIMALWRAVLAGITKALLPLGADPGALSNAMRIKNPLSPFWGIRIWNETTFPTLSEWAGWVDTSTNRDRMIRESAATLSGTGRKASNALFTTYQEWSYAKLRELDHASDPAYVNAVLRKDTDSLADLLFHSLVGRASAMAASPKQAKAILYRVVAYAADHWDPSRCRKNAARDRGACADEVAGLDGVAARQAVGARHAAALNKARKAEIIRSAIVAARAAGEAVTKSGIAKRTGISRPTVIAHWPEEECQKRCIVKKKASAPAIPSNPDAPSSNAGGSGSLPEPCFESPEPRRRSILPVVELLDLHLAGLARRHPPIPIFVIVEGIRHIRIDRPRTIPPFGMKAKRSEQVGPHGRVQRHEFLRALEHGQFHVDVGEHAPLQQPACPVDLATPVPERRPGISLLGDQPADETGFESRDAIAAMPGQDRPADSLRDRRRKGIGDHQVPGAHGGVPAPIRGKALQGGELFPCQRLCLPGVGCILRMWLVFRSDLAS